MPLTTRVGCRTRSKFRVVVAPWHPVKTELLALEESPPATGRLRIVRSANHTVVGDHAVAGVPWGITREIPHTGPVIAVVTRDVGYKLAVPRILEAARRVKEQGKPNDLLERLGYVFLLTKDIVPARQEVVRLAGLNERVEPACHGRR